MTLVILAIERSTPECFFQPQLQKFRICSAVDEKSTARPWCHCISYSNSWAELIICSLETACKLFSKQSYGSSAKSITYFLIPLYPYQPHFADDTKIMTPGPKYQVNKGFVKKKQNQVSVKSRNRPPDCESK